MCLKPKQALGTCVLCLASFFRDWCKNKHMNCAFVCGLDVNEQRLM